jgi:hypothetical protein
MIFLLKEVCSVQSEHAKKVLASHGLIICGSGRERNSLKR